MRRSLGASGSPTATLAEAIQRLGFVQADPIRAPARAQDLILRQRVAGYRAGDLERDYAAMDMEEDFLYAYGFVSRGVWQTLHPRRGAGGSLSALDRRLLEWVAERGPTHPAALEAEFGKARVVNAWGGSSKATTAALERLHHRGLLRVARRERGVRVYEATRAAPVEEGAGRRGLGERYAEILLAAIQVLAPISEPTLGTIAGWLRRPLPGRVDHRRTIAALLASGRLRRDVVDGVTYLDVVDEVDAADAADASEGEPMVRFLAPFDPVVWDRRRFEHLWGWAYRFEAYTPVAKRVRGYYALPLAWGDRVIGWANVSGGVDGAPIDVDVGFVGRRPRGRELTRALDAEVARMEDFLGGESGRSRAGQRKGQ